MSENDKILQDILRPDGSTIYISAGDINTDYEEHWSNDKFKSSSIILNCPHCQREFRPLLSKFTRYVHSGSYSPSHSAITGSITFYTRYLTYCRKCKNHFEFTLSNDS